MFGYFVRYFIARASYDAVRASVRRRPAKVNRAVAQENLRQANERLRLAKAKVAALRAPTLDDNMLVIGRQHAVIGMKIREVDACYGEGEELPSPTTGVTLRAYRLNAFCACVSFWKGHSFQETWTKADAVNSKWESAEILALLENKTPGHLWSPLKSSSQRLHWWASPLGLVGCFEIRDAGQVLLHIADPKHGAPSTMPTLPAAALPAPAIPEPEQKSRGGILTIVILGVIFFVLYSLYQTGKDISTNHSQPVAQYTPSFASTPSPPRALPVDTPASVMHAYVPRAAAVANSVSPPSTEQSYSVVGIAAGDTLNVRGGAGSNYSISAKLPKGYTNIHILGAPVMNGPTEWVNISFGNCSGWVTKQYLKAE